MREAMLGRRHGETNWILILGPNNTHTEHRAFWNARKFRTQDRTYAEVLWTKGGQHKHFSDTEDDFETSSLTESSSTTSVSSVSESSSSSKSSESSLSTVNSSSSGSTSSSTSSSSDI